MICLIIGTDSLRASLYNDRNDKIEIDDRTGYSARNTRLLIQDLYTLWLAQLVAARRRPFNCV